jgi:hypothetical protein
MSNIARMMQMAAAGVSADAISYTHVADSTSTDSATIVIPATAQVGDIAVLFDSTVGPTNVYPSGWTGIYEESDTFDTSVSYKLLQIGDAGSTVTGMGTSSWNLKTMHVFRPSTSVFTVTVSSLNASGSLNTEPPQQAMNVAAAPAIVFGMIRAYINTPFVDETFWDAEVFNSEPDGNKMKSYYEIQNDGATDRTITASADYGNYNFAMGFVINATTSGVVWTDPDIANASYDSVSLDVSAQDGGPTDIQFSENGMKLFMYGINSDDIFEYGLTTAFDISTASYSQSAPAGVGGNTYGMFFRGDGLKVYVVNIEAIIYQYSLSTAWDISTLSYDSVAFDASAQVGSLRDMWIKPDGTKMYLIGATGDDINEYDLSTAWNVSTSSYVQNFSVALQDNTPTGLYFNPTGTKFWIFGFTNKTVFEYDLSAAWDVSSASYSSLSFSVSSQSTIGIGFTFAGNGAKMYISSVGTDTIYQYSTEEPAVVSWTNPDIANASYDSVSFSVSAQESVPLTVLFNNDGTKMYMLGNSDTVYQYSLSTGFDLSTASYDSVSFNFSTQDTTARGVAFNTDGSKLYMAGISNDAVYQYSLSTAFDLSTISYDSVSFNISGQDVQASEIVFNTDGTKMFMIGLNTDAIYQYSLSTGFDLSTASYDSVSFDVSGQDAIPYDLDINPDGTKMYVMGSGTDAVYQYSLSTAFDLSTASYDSVSFSVSSQETSPSGLAFNNAGTKMYIVGPDTDTIYQYSTN